MEDDKIIIGIEGFLGDGKTIYMVYCLIRDYLKGRKIFTNLKLTNIEYELFKVDEFLNDENNDKLNNATIGIDEITVFMDCRRSSKKENIALSYLILQSRKRNLDIYYTTQNMDFCDLRLIQYTSIFVIAQRCYKQVIDNYGNTKLEELEKIRNYTIIDSRMRKDNITRINMNIEPFFKHYDTNQIIEPLFRTNKDVKKTT